MSILSRCFKEKLTWIGAGAIILIVLLLSTALVYPTVHPKPKNIPVAILVQDKGIDIPNKGSMNYGDIIKKKVKMKRSKAPLKWTIINSMKSLQYGLNHQKYYGAIVVPFGFTEKILSFKNAVPSSAEVKFYINQGMNYNISNLVTQGFNKIAAGINSEFRKEIIAQISKRSKVVTLSQIKFLSLPIISRNFITHPVGTHSSSGNAPASLSQITWISVLIGCVFVYLVRKKVKDLDNKFGITFVQLLMGILMSILVSTSVILVAGYGYGLHIYDMEKTCLFIMLVAYCFYLFQTSILNLIGIAGAAICMLIFFFTNPILSMGKELIPSYTYNLLYQWVPLRFSSEGLRDILYFHKDLNLSAPLWALIITGVICIFVIFLSEVFMRNKLSDNQTAA